MAFGVATAIEDKEYQKEQINKLVIENELLKRKLKQYELKEKYSELEEMIDDVSMSCTKQKTIDYVIELLRKEQIKIEEQML